MLKIGLTGGIGCGKTTVAGMFAKRGAKVINADELVHELLIFREDVKEKIITLYGEDILSHSDGNIDRGKLAQKCFVTKEQLEPLTTLLYPEVRTQVWSAMESFSQEGITLCVVDAPVLLEAGFEPLFDRIMLVIAPPDIQFKRLVQKGFTIGQIKARMHFQWPTWIKARYADFIINNGGRREDTQKRFNKIFFENFYVRAHQGELSHLKR
ncbi:MAG: dephospho-CoA kinase [bacterium]